MSRTGKPFHEDLPPSVSNVKRCCSFGHLLGGASWASDILAVLLPRFLAMQGLDRSWPVYNGISSGTYSSCGLSLEVVPIALDRVRTRWLVWVRAPFQSSGNHELTCWDSWSSYLQAMDGIVSSSSLNSLQDAKTARRSLQRKAFR